MAKQPVDIHRQKSEPPKHGLKIGQQVHCSKDLGSVCDLRNEPLCAIITAVNLDGTVNLCVFDRDGKTHAQQYVPVVTEHTKDKKQKLDFCCPANGDTDSVLWDAE